MKTATVLTEMLGGSALSRAARAGELDGRWYRSTPEGRGGWERYVREVRDSVRASWLAEVLPAIEPAGVAAERLERAAASGVVITTGQQPGLFGGPLMTFAKALSTRAYADALQERVGVPVAPIFWAATDDADFDEAAVVSVAGSGGAEVLRLDRAAPIGTPMSKVPLSANISEHAQRLRDACGSVADRHALDAALHAYAGDATIGGAYVRLLRALLEPLGIAVLDASHPAIATAARPLFRRTISTARDLASVLHARYEEIRAADFKPQVEEVTGLSLLFTNRDGVKRRLSLAELDAAGVDADAMALSSTVLLRPVMERAILPSAFYVAGPGEHAYFAQVSAVADALESPQPLVQPRWSVTIIEPKVQRQLDELGVDRTAFRDPAAVEQRIARELVPAPLTNAVQTLREHVQRGMDGLREANDSLVPDAVLDGLHRSLAHRLDRAERRLVAAVKRRETEAMRRIAALRGALYPHGAPQERKLSYIPFLARYGTGLIDEMLMQAYAHARSRLADEPAPVSESARAPALHE